MDKRLKRLLFYYICSALGVTFVLSGTIISHLYAASLAKTLSQFETLKIHQIKMKGAIKKIEKTTVEIGLIIPYSYKPEEMGERILTAIDSIKTRLRGVNITLGNFDRRENELFLPVTLTGVIDSYVVFVKEVGYLQSMISPVMLIDSVSMAKATTKEEVSYEIKGVMKIISRSKGGNI